MRDVSLIFLPGLLCTVELFRGQLARLPEGFRGEGRELAPLGSMEDLARTLWLAIEGRVVLCGLSLGGIVCMEMLQQRPERVRGLILMDTNAKNEGEAVSRERRRLLAAAEKSSPGQIARSVLFERQVHPSLWQERSLKDVVGRMADQCGLGTFARHAAALEARRDYSSFLQTTDCPVLILSGEADRICPEEKQSHLQAVLPQAERVSIPGAGHLSSLEQPDAVSDCINRWLLRAFPHETV